DIEFAEEAGGSMNPPRVQKPVQKDEGQAPRGDAKAALAAGRARGVSQRWGILEASQRISAVRLQSQARTQAAQERPVPPRDLEIKEGKRVAAESKTLDDLLREELQ
ncbi:MAG: hypothetical protein ACXV8X_16350, partial [Candidatus Angelobacter sp.]